MNENSELITIGCSWLNEQSFCEYKIFLKKCKGIEIPPTKEMAEGTKDHETALAEHKERADITMKVDDALKSDLALVARELPVECVIEDIHLMGIIDEVHTSKDSVIITDDKRSTYAGYGPKKQVGAYCLAMESTLKKLGVEKKVVARLRRRKTDEIFWEDNFSDEMRKDTLESLYRLRDVLTDKRPPEPTKNPKKCAKCNAQCDMRVADYMC